MPRLEADHRISIKSRASGKSHKIELIRMKNCNRFWVRYNGRNSTKVPNGATLTWVVNEMRKLLTTKKGES